jgi:hypothetical protein
VHVVLVRPVELEHGVLSPAGSARAQALGDRLRWYDCEPTRLFTCAAGVPTAELLARTFTDPPHVEAVAWLSAPSADAAARIRDAAEHALIAVVCDEPVLSHLAASLLGAPFAPLARAHAARIVNAALRWRFAWNAEAPESAP